MVAGPYNKQSDHVDVNDENLRGAYIWKEHYEATITDS